MATRILSRVFGGAVRLRNSLYDAGALPAKRLKGPVVSIGNLAVGGSGKTPFVILLGELLKSARHRLRRAIARLSPPDAKESRWWIRAGCRAISATSPC